MLKLSYTIFKKLRLNKLYSFVKPILPKSLTKEIGSLSAKYDPSPLVSVDEIKPKYKKGCEFLISKIGRANIKDYLEFGVCHGTSLNCMFETLRELKLDNVRLFGFDSFEGLPPSAAFETENNWNPGDFASSLEFTTKRLTAKGVDWKRTFLVKGWYSDTLTDSFIKKHDIAKASIIMIDCDLYSSSKESLNFCAPLIKDLSIIFFDDWNPKEYMGEEKAFDEFLKENSHLKAELFDTYLPSGRIFIVTNTGSQK